MKNKLKEMKENFKEEQNYNKNNLLIDELEEATEFLLDDVQALGFLGQEFVGNTKNKKFYIKIETIRKSMTYGLNHLEKVIDNYYQNKIFKNSNKERR